MATNDSPLLPPRKRASHARRDRVEAYHWSAFQRVHGSPWQWRFYRRLWRELPELLEESLDWTTARTAWFLWRVWRNSYGKLGAALVAIGLALGVWGGGWRASPLPQAAAYLDAASAAIRANKSQDAERYLQAATELVASQPQFLTRVAQVAEELGGVPRVRVLMSRLASFDDSGLPPAHLWLAQDLLRQMPPPPQDAQLATEHLRWVLHRDSKNVEALSRLSELLMAQGLYREAEALLKRTAGQNPELGLILAQVELQLGHTHAARRRAAELVGPYRKLAQASPDDAHYRVACAKCYRLLGRYETALEVLQAEADPDNSAVCREATAICLTWYEEVREKETASGRH